jgi:hypothetical protein
VVAIAPPPQSEEAPERKNAGWKWRWAAVGILVLGLAGRVALGGGGIGDFSAVVMLVLVGVSVWLATWALSQSERAACVAILIAVIVVDFGALPTRNMAGYDERDALFRTDQAVARTLPVDASLGSGQKPTVLTVVAEAVYPSALQQPQFQVAADVGQTPLQWQCTFGRGVQTFALPVPASALADQSAVDVQLRVTGTPTREDDYLLVYSSSARGGYLMSLDDASALGADVTRCTPR